MNEGAGITRHRVRGASAVEALKDNYDFITNRTFKLNDITFIPCNITIVPPYKVKEKRMYHFAGAELLCGLDWPLEARPSDVHVLRVAVLRQEFQ